MWMEGLLVVNAVPIDKTSNGMPYVKYSTVETSSGPLYDLMTGEPYRYLDSLVRARSAFPGMLHAAVGDDEDMELLQDMQCLINVITSDEIMRDDQIDEHKHGPSPPAPTSAVVQEKTQKLSKRAGTTYVTTCVTAC